MQRQLEGARCVVVAAGQGIGRSVALAFADEGAEVVAVDFNADALASLAACGIETHCFDAREAAPFMLIAEASDPVDVLVNCAGRVVQGDILACEATELFASFESNLLPMHNAIRAMLPGMKARASGSIINIASVASSVTGLAERYAYGTAKAAVIGLTKSVARDFLPYGIRCNAISPGTIDSPSLRQRIAEAPDPATAEATFLARQPMGRFGHADEVARAALLLACDRGGFITGQNIIVDGGLSL